MTVVNIYDAQTRLSELIDKAAAGQDVIIARRGKPIARLTQLDAPRHKLRFGVLKGKIKISENFDAPLPSEIVTSFDRS